MELHELPFGKIIIIRKDVAEVIINEDIEMNDEIVKQFHKFILKNLSSPFSLLINKINNYTYSFEAQKKLGSLSELKAIAIIAYNKISKISSKSVASFPREIKWNMKLFSNRNDAMDWIMAENQKHNN